jgi:hypothetical protein
VSRRATSSFIPSRLLLLHSIFGVHGKGRERILINVWALLLLCVTLTPLNIDLFSHHFQLCLQRKNSGVSAFIVTTCCGCLLCFCASTVWTRLSSLTSVFTPDLVFCAKTMCPRCPLTNILRHFPGRFGRCRPRKPVLHHQRS